MKKKLNRMLDWLADYFAHRKGLLPILGLVLILINGVLQFTPLQNGVLSETNFFLHLGLILAILGFLLAWSL